METEDDFYNANELSEDESGNEFMDDQYDKYSERKKIQEQSQIEQEEEPVPMNLPSEKSNSKPLHQDDDNQSEYTQKNNVILINLYLNNLFKEKETAFISQNETTQGHATTQETQNYVPTTQEFPSARQETLSQNPKPFAGLSFGVVGEMNSVTQKEVINILESLGA